MDKNYRDMQKIEGVCEEAMAAFWQVVAEAYPEITSGDLSPCAVEAFEIAATTAIKTWVEMNKNT